MALLRWRVCLPHRAAAKKALGRLRPRVPSVNLLHQSEFLVHLSMGALHIHGDRVRNAQDPARSLQTICDDLRALGQIIEGHSHVLEQQKDIIALNSCPVPLTVRGTQALTVRGIVSVSWWTGPYNCRLVRRVRHKPQAAAQGPEPRTNQEDQGRRWHHLPQGRDGNDARRARRRAHGGLVAPTTRSHEGPRFKTRPKQSHPKNLYLCRA